MMCREYRTRRRPFADDQVELKILHRRIEDFLHRRIEPVDLVDEQHVALFEIGEQRREIAGLRDDRARGGAETDAEFANFLRNSTIRNLSRSWPKRKDRAHLIRYEDLITRPAETLQGVLAYLEVDASSAVVDGMIDRASAENPEMKRHLTSSDVSTSLGRWKSSLSPELQTVANSAFGDVLQQFGYQV